MAVPSLLDHIKYKYHILIENTTTGTEYDVSKAFENAIWTTFRQSSSPGTLEVTIKEGIHPTDTVIHEGSMITFGINGRNWFYGRIKAVELLNNGEQGYVWRVQAENALSLLSMVENAKREHGMTASDFFQYLMDKYSNRGLRGAVIEPSTIPLDREYYMGYSLFAMMDDSLDLTHSMTADSRYIIRDNLGILEFRELRALRTPYILGDESFTSSYSYTANINTDTYNVIKVVRFNDNTGFIDVWQVYDSGNIDRWGWRQRTVDAEDFLTDAEIDKFASLMLEAKNRPIRSGRLTCVGIDDPMLQAGAGVQVRINRKQIDHLMPADVITHFFSPIAHEMDIEVSIVV